MLLSLLLIAAGLVLLYFGAEWLVSGASALALALGLTPLAVGLTVVAYGTSAPEFVVSLTTSLAGRGDLALGNVVGSNIGNIGLILGLTALVRVASVQSQIVRLDIPLLIGVSLVFAALLLDGTLSRVDGAVLLLAALSYTVFVLRAARRETAAARGEAAAAATGVTGGVVALPVELPDDAAVVRPTWFRVGQIVAGLGLLVGGGRLLVTGAVTIAEALGLSDAVIGLTVVAIGTSLPELATSLVAAVRGQSDIAIGNIVGSNLFNLMAVMGTASLARPVAAEGISEVDFAVMLAFTVLLLPIARSGFRIVRWEGAVLLAGYATYVGFLLAR